MINIILVFVVIYLGIALLKGAVGMIIPFIISVVATLAHFIYKRLIIKNNK